jgi:alanine dehydrogenase
MNIGIVKEDARRERRIALTPAAVQSLIGSGNKVYVERDAGSASHFTNEEYKMVGAQIVYTNDEVFGRADMVLKISPPTEDDCSRLSNGQILFSFLHLPVLKTQIMKSLLDKSICSIGYELIEDDAGNLPILQQMSEIAGQMCIHVAARHLESSNNGRGIVLGGISGVPAALVVILGAGTVGQAATRTALGVGAKVIVFDKDVSRLRLIEQMFDRRVSTMVINQFNLSRMLRNADVLIGAVLMKGEKTPHLITEEMVKQMKPGSLVIDVSIDQGGCVETSRPTTIENPTYILHDVIHYCVPNMAANVSRTATYGLTNAMLSYVFEITEKGIYRAVQENAGLAAGVCTFKGNCTIETVARRFEVEPAEIHSLIER